MMWIPIFLGKEQHQPQHRHRKRKDMVWYQHASVGLLLLLLFSDRCWSPVSSEVIREFEISEGVPVGTSIGFIGEPTPGSSNSPPPPPYLIVPVPGSSVDTDLTIDQSNGEILTKVQLDRETRDSYSLVAIPITGENIRVIIRVKDENDNAPEFPMSSMSVEFPENTPRDVKRTLAPARDKDLGIYNTQRYTISAGNVNNAFRLSSHRERDGVLYLDLQVNGFLDRETIPSYNLLIEAFDGGNPPLKGSMTINITITDQNDNAPVWQFARLPNGDSQYMDDDITFNQSRYFATVAENASVGTSVLQVFALDQDEGPNGQITYSINRRQTDKESVFKIDPVTGVISVNRPLDYESKEVHELVAVARDNGIQPLEATVFVSIRIIDLNDNQLKIKISFFSDDSDNKPPTVSENAQPGEFVARISVHDPDSKQEYENVNMVLEGGEGNFALENRNGVVYLVVASRNLDRETKANYSFTIIAKDPENPNVNTSTSFLLQIGDENDSAPKFERESYEASVSEVATPGTSVVTVRAVDADLGNNSAIIYSLKAAYSSGSSLSGSNSATSASPDRNLKWFDIDPETGVITTKQHLDCETDPMPRLIVTAQDKGEPPLSSSATVTVHLIDSNDTPLFDQSFYNASVMENTPIGRCILKVSASDPDCGINAVVTYSFQYSKSSSTFRLQGSPPPQLPFSVNKDTGEICVTGVLDFESRHAYEIPVVATDTGGLSSTAIVKIMLEDQNDNVPVFFPAKYNISLKERYVPDGPIISVAAVDRDSGKFGQVSYFIHSGNDRGYFEVDSKTGEIRVTHGLPRETATHQLLVSAKDGSGAVAEKPAVVTVTVVDSQQQPPLFKQTRYSFAISEDAPVGSFVGAVALSSPSSGRKVRFAISSGDPEAYFTIDPSNGVIKTANKLDHELHSNILLNVQAVGEQSPTTFSHCQVDIRVTDVNDNRPEFEMNQVSIWVPENAKVGSVIYALNARDQDSGHNGQVVYSWIQGPQDIFKFDGTTGRITLKKQLDYEDTKGYLIAVGARDMGTPPLHSNNLTINLEIQDYNDNAPQWQPDMIQFRLRERVQAGSQVGRLSPANKPAGGAIKYALQSMQNVFRIDPNLGIVTTAVSLDRGKVSSYKFTAAAFNQAMAQHKANITVNLHLADTRDKKAGTVDTMSRDFFQGEVKYQVTVSESLPVDSKILTVVALDEDTGNNARIRYSLSNEGVDDMFYMLPHGGTLYLKQMLDRETKDQYEVKVIAADHGSPSLTSTAVISITVQDENDHAPLFDQKLYQFAFEENNKPGTVVGQVRAVDEDVGDNGSVSYSLQPQHGDFQIDARTGVVRAISSLDREKQSLYELQVLAMDQGSPQLQSDVIIHVVVTDTNDNNPKITDPEQDTLLVREQSPIGTEIAHVEAIDLDWGENSTIVFALSHDGFTDGKDFTIEPETGILRTKSPLSHEKKRLYTLTVIARDRGSPGRESRRDYRVEVLDASDSRATSIISRNKYSFKVAENATVGFLIGSIMVRIEDSNARLTYTIMKGNEQGKFEINRASGAILVVEPLDHEKTSHYLLEVRVNMDSDMNSEEAVVTLDIEVLDVNDEPPKFPEDPMTVSIPENHGLGLPVWNFTAVDRDGGLNGIIHYSIREQRPQDKFRINTLTGSLYLQSPLDFESCSSYVLIVEAADQSPVISDRLSTSVTVHVLVEDENDNEPHFTSVTNIIVYKWEPPNTVLHTVMAYDKDAGDNGLVSYEITGGNLNSELALDPLTGQLSLVKPLKRDGVFSLNVTAKDNGHPKRKSSTQLLTVTVKDVMDSPPQFSSRKFEVSVLEGTPIGNSIFQITAFPGDNQQMAGAQQNEKLEYLIPEGAAEGKFSIDKHTGTMYVAGKLDREERSEYTLTVYVHDSSYMSFFDMTTIVIRVTDVNDNKPNFEDTCVDLSVPENSDLGVIHTFTAVDPDVGRNGDVSFTIAGGNVDNMFTVDLHSGRLTCRPLDRERRAQYNLVIVAQDQGVPPQKTQCNLTVTVDDENDSPIVFMASNKSATALSPYNISEAMFHDSSPGSGGSGGQPSYYASIPEDIPIGTTVLFVEAKDADIGINSKIRYALNNESHWHFSVDNETGAIVTAGQLDRETIKDYMFEVAATDGGTYDFRSATALVHLRVTDTNDNRPEFRVNPVVVSVPVYTKPGQSICQVQASDLDEGLNGQVTYSVVDTASRSSSLFRIQSQTGQVSAVSSLSSDSGNVFHLQVLAKDKGNPSKSSMALVVIKVGEETGATNVLAFQQQEYLQNLPEDSPTGTSVVKVLALRADGRRSNIIYSIIAGNEDDVFDISSSKGVIRVKNSEKLDREVKSIFNLVVTARPQDDDTGGLNAHSLVTVNLTDVNDSKPKFTQNSYFASVWEGNSKGTFVTQVTATDNDLGTNASLIYHIVDGNNDNAFLIDPPFSGIVKTNIVLDREITDEYRLTIIATDEGIPQMTGTCYLHVNVIDIQDQSPVFPPHSVINVSESVPVGTVITTVVANDVDTNPSLVYSFANREQNPMFFIGKYSGRITLARPLDYESKKVHKVDIQVSDSVHTAKTTLTVNVMDANDHNPVFTEDPYRITISDELKPGTKVVEVVAKDKDSGMNAKIKYSLEVPKDSKLRGPCFLRIDEESGVIYTNSTMNNREENPYFVLILVATDQGEEKRESRATLWVEVSSSESSLLRFSHTQQSVHITRDTKPGSVLTQLKADCVKNLCKNLHFHYTISSGNPDNIFTIGTHTGQILLAKPLLKSSEEHKLRVSVDCMNKAKCMASTDVLIHISDSNSEALRFPQEVYSVEISESSAVGSSLIQLMNEVEPNYGHQGQDETTDAFHHSNSRSSVIFSITSGNEDRLVELNPFNGRLSLKRSLDYDSRKSHRVVVKAEDPESRQWALAIVDVEVKDENDHEPFFLFPNYLEFVGENEPVGTSVFTARATDLDKGLYGKLNYSIFGGDGKDKFRIHTGSGVVTTNAVFDYETKHRYTLKISASDLGGKTCSAEFIVEIESRDEFAPQFVHKSYKFSVPINAGKGYTLGKVEATDRDMGRDGIVRYQFDTSRTGNSKSPFRVNRTTGYITVKEPLNDRNMSLFVVASSGRPESRMAEALVEITVGAPSEELEASYTTSSVADWVLGLLVTTLLVLFLCCTIFLVLHLRNKKQNKTEKQAQVFNSSSNFGTLEYGAQSTMVLNSGASGAVQGQPSGLYHDHHHHHHQQYGAEQYADRRCGVNNTASEISDQSNSASSGRGSAEYGEEVEDEEIRMINEGSLINAQQQKYIPDSGIIKDSHESDDVSQSSAKNTQEYLARLGIRPKIPTQDSISNVYGDVESGGGPRAGSSSQDPVDISNLIYAQIADDVTDSEMMDERGGQYSTPTGAHQQVMNGSLSSIVHNEEELTGSYNWDYLLDWGPQYQPLAHVFSEIACFKDDNSGGTSGVGGSTRGERGGGGGGGGQSSNSDAESSRSSHHHPPSEAISYGRKSGSHLKGKVIAAQVGRGGQSGGMGSTHSSSVSRAAGGGVGPSSSLHHSILPRSPISHDSTFASGLISPSFSPALSPLANRSPSISPLGGASSNTAVIRTSQYHQNYSSSSDSEFRK